MKKTFALLLAVCLCLLVLAACGGASSSAPVAPASSTAPAAASAAPASSAPASTPTADGADLSAALASMVEAAELGATIDVTEIDLQAAGVSVDNVVAFAGAFSQLSAQNGGVVILIQAAPDTAKTVFDELAAYRDASVNNTDYAEFEEARANTENGTILQYGDMVVYAVSATGNMEAVTTAADALYMG